MNSHNENKKVFSCLVVDDEPMARDVLCRYIGKIPTLTLSGECSSGIDALIFLQAQTVDIIFLDIRMPELLGTEFVQSLENPPDIIFTTAYPEYALDGFELDVTDYLLKPIRFERFLKAINKVTKYNTENTLISPAETNGRKPSQDFIYIRVDRKLIKIILSELLYIESAKDYVKFFFDNKFYITRQTISSIEAMLNTHEFIRIHRSYIVSLNKIKSFTSEVVEIGNKELPIGKYYRNNFNLVTSGYSS